MANFWYPHPLHLLGQGTFILDPLEVGNETLAALLVITGTTALQDDANRDVVALSGFGTLAEHPSAGRPTLANVSYDKDAGNNRTEITADPTVFTSLADPGGGNQVEAVIVYAERGLDSVDVPIAAFDTGGFPFTPTGSDNTVNWNAEGALQLA